MYELDFLLIEEKKIKRSKEKERQFRRKIDYTKRQRHRLKKERKKRELACVKSMHLCTPPIKVSLPTYWAGSNNASGHL